MADYKPSTEEGKCIFCEIIKGNIEPLGGGKFWEDEKCIAFLSPFPNTEGFTVLITKEHYPSDVLKMPDKELSDLILSAKKVSKILIDKLDDVGRVGLIMEGTGINHSHIKLIPLNGTGYMKKGEWRQVHSKVNLYFKNYEGYISSNDGPKADLDNLKKLAERLKK